MKHPKSKIISLVSAISVTLIINGCATTPPHSLAQKIDQDMVLVEGGQFTMGADNPSAQKSERPARTVNVDGFYLSKFEVTQSLFEAVTGSSLSYFRDPNTPVNNISWQQANYLIKKLNEKTGEHYRLPTEAEWEFAAKGGILSKGFTFSGSNNIDDVAWYANNSHNQAHKVGQKQPNELGLYDMTGNVGEFVIDAFDEGYYKTAPSDNPVNAKEEKESLAHKSVRGGSFAYNADESENYRRDFASQSVIMSDMGLRLAKDVD
ncbi:formylglycine-generating enzyme family protein [Vibrio diabolicus]|uniref:formylglycine-generating enzyme family protein n=1 Tax=Vibrio diabolicus TaxID=50719 RepID=UPI0021604110|nr:formylglycine-generating enzyme family protein [Vibrio diabolicus]MCS0368951.1 formylglycine-generating enzyme family protein [Vibrio diabolicus]